VVENGVDPWAVQPDDWGALAARIPGEMARDPKGAIAALVPRAALVLRAQALGSAPAASPTPLQVTLESRFDLGFDCLVRVDVEGSWDGGPWTRLGTGAWVPRDCGRGPAWRFSLPRSFAATPGPHTLEGRARVSLLRPESPREEWPLPPCAASWSGPTPDPFVGLLALGEVLYEEERSLGTFPVKLLGE
jgi:hypothetical protein